MSVAIPFSSVQISLLEDLQVVDNLVEEEPKTFLEEALPSRGAEEVEELTCLPMYRTVEIIPVAKVFKKVRDEFLSSRSEVYT